MVLVLDIFDMLSTYDFQSRSDLQKALNSSLDGLKAIYQGLIVGQTVENVKTYMSNMILIKSEPDVFLHKILGKILSGVRE